MKKFSIINSRDKILNILIAGLIPIIAMFILLLSQNVWFGDLSISSSKWNDELFYYKQLEGILAYGHPIGYWGFNESHSLYGNFAAWNPSVFIFYVLFAKAFGLSYATPIIVNTIVLTIAFILFVMLCSPSKSQLLLVMAIFCSYSIGIRYIFSVTPETIILALLIIYCSLLYRIDKHHVGSLLVLSYIIFFLLVVMRGYYAAFSLIMLAILYKHRDIKGSVLQIIITGFSAATFMITNKFFTAEYFEPIVHFDWAGNISLIPRYFINGLGTTIYFIGEALKFSSMRGSWYICYFLVGVIFLIYALGKRDLVRYSIITVWFVILVAMWLVYKPDEGCRHIMDIELTALLFVPMLFDKKRVLFISLLTVVALTWCSKESFYTALPVKNDTLYSEIESQQLDQVMLQSDDPWDNTVGWLGSSDTHNELYALPDGFAVNCCLEDYVVENITNLKMRYMAVEKNSNIDNLMQKEKYVKVAEYGRIKIYDLR